MLKLNLFKRLYLFLSKKFNNLFHTADTSSNSGIEEYSDVDFVNSFVACFKEKAGRYPTLDEIKMVGDMVSESFAGAIALSNQTNQQIKVTANFHFENREEEEESVCNIPEEISNPIRELSIKLSNPFSEETPASLAVDLIQKIKRDRKNFDDPSWEILLRYTAFTCFQGILIRKGGNEAMDFYLNWLLENVPAATIRDAKREAMFAVLNNLSIPAATQMMSNFLTEHLEKIHQIEIIDKSDRADLN